MVALLDSSVIAGFLDRGDLFAAASGRIRERAGHRRFTVSVITYAELLAGAELGHHDEMTIRGFFSDLVEVVHPVDDDVAEGAARLRGRNPSLRLPDALILATADVSGADVVLTADHRWPAVLPHRQVEVLLGG